MPSSDSFVELKPNTTAPKAKLVYDFCKADKLRIICLSSLKAEQVSLCYVSTDVDLQID